MPDGGSAPPRPQVPAQLRALAEAIGAAGVLRLVERRGGTMVYVPSKQLSPKRGLGRELELDAAACARLRALHGNEKIRVPLVRQWRARVYRLQGDSYTQIALRLGVSDVAVHKYLSDARLTNQLSLPL